RPSVSRRDERLGSAPISRRRGQITQPLPEGFSLRRSHEQKAALYGRVGQALNAAASVLGAVGAIWGAGYVEAWVAVIGTMAAAVGTYALSQRFQRLAATYRVTADRLAVRLALWEVTTLVQPDSAADRALVLDVEDIMAAENEAWLADLSKDPATSPQVGR
ncbi:SLATT domain-containing protein, partial [Dankookia rubra]